MSIQNSSRRSSEINAVVYRLMESKGLTFREAWNFAAHDPDTASLFNAMEKRVKPVKGPVVAPHRSSRGGTHQSASQGAEGAIYLANQTTNTKTERQNQMKDPGNVPQRSAIIQDWVARALTTNPRLTYLEAFNLCSQDPEMKPIFAAMHRPGRTVSDDAPAIGRTASDGKKPGTITGADMSGKVLRKQPNPGSREKDGMPSGSAAGPGVNAMRAAKGQS
jgi:hypothetical protein